MAENRMAIAKYQKKRLAFKKALCYNIQALRTPVPRRKGAVFKNGCSGLGLAEEKNLRRTQQWQSYL